MKLSSKFSFALRAPLVTGLAVSMSLAALGCGHDDNAPLYSSGVDSTKRASTLSDADKNQFCRSLDQHVDVVIGFQEIARIVCLPLALLSASQAECEHKLDTCAAQPPSSITVNAQSTHDQACFNSLASCEANVSTLEGCVNVNVGLVRAVLETITCARFGDTSAASDARAVMDPTGSTCASSSSSCGQATTLLL
ncbi:MAG: hypothetical protein JWN04_3357 [Myxococcaceae bacterium]|nr:hypothetical protein [Myxococcaceae bacterium]